MVKQQSYILRLQTVRRASFGLAENDIQDAFADPHRN